jgi:hypothetical protein
MLAVSAALKIVLNNIETAENWVWVRKLVLRGVPFRPLTSI